ncbi:hypothetical protein FS749_001450 [Ceratobasidium sp. UAMH 11750]|nr:hypothetical protein FS749_001450 [Ceratobasidium sp. UAMH 11750]
MSTKSIKAGYLTTAWDEKTVSAEGAAIKITRVRSERKFTGAMEGTAVAEYIICYHPDSKSPEGPHAGKPTSSYVGTCHFKGSIDGNPEGEVVFLATNGTLITTAEADWTVDEKTAIGGLKGLKGKGGYKHAVDASWTDPTSVWLEYTL